MSINEHNYRDILISYTEDQLKPAEREEVERFMLLHEEAWEEYQALKRIRLKPDMTMAFPKKHLLMREEEEDEVVLKPLPIAEPETEGRVVPMRRTLWYISGAAAIAAMLILSIFVYKPGKQDAALTASQAAPKTEQNNLAGRKTEVKENPALAQTGPVAEPEKVDAGQNAEVEHATAGQNVKVKYNAVKQAVKNAGSEKTQIAKTDRGGQLNKDNGNTLQVQTETVAVQQQGANEKQPVASISQVSVPQVLATQEGTKENKVPVLKPIRNTTQAVAAADNTDDDGFNLLQGLYKLVRQDVKVKKQTINGEKYYAVSLETEKVSFSKSIRTDF